MKINWNERNSQYVYISGSVKTYRWLKQKQENTDMYSNRGP